MAKTPSIFFAIKTTPYMKDNQRRRGKHGRNEN